MAVSASFSSAGSTQIINFTDTSTGSPTHWLWDFGDNIFSDEQSPTHIYELAGYYSVKLTVLVQTSEAQVNSSGTSEFRVGSKTTTIFDPIENAYDEAWSDFSVFPWSTPSGINGDMYYSTQHIGGSNTAFYTIRSVRKDASYDLTSYTSGQICKYYVVYRVETEPWSYAIVNNLYNVDRSRANDGISILVADVSSFGSGTFTTTIIDGNEYSKPPIIAPWSAGGKTGGWLINDSYVTVQNWSSLDSNTQNLSVSTPTIDFSGTPRSGFSPHNVQFQDLSNINGIKYEWDFGDGNTVTTSGLTNPVNTYITNTT